MVNGSWWVRARCFSAGLNHRAADHPAGTAAHRVVNLHEFWDINARTPEHPFHRCANLTPCNSLAHFVCLELAYQPRLGHYLRLKVKDELVTRPVRCSGMESRARMLSVIRNVGDNRSFWPFEGIADLTTLT